MRKISIKGKGILLPEIQSFLYYNSYIYFFIFLSMKKIIFIILGLLILGSCTLQKSTKNTSPVSNDVPSVGTTTYTEDIENTSSKIKDTDEFKSCMKQQATMCIQSTGMQIAQKMKDTAFCKELSTPEQQGSCEFAITMINAQEKNDEKLCDTLTDKNYIKQCKIQIYRQDAITKKDIILCDKINSLSSGTGANETIDINTQKDQCVMQFIMSVQESKEADCTKLTNDSSLEMCKMMIRNKAQSTPPPTPTEN